MVRSRRPLFVGLVAFVCAGCSLPGSGAAPTSTTEPPDLVAYWAERGESDPVAECITELGRRSFSSEELLTAADGGSVDPETDAQLSELVASCRLAHDEATEVAPTLEIVGNAPTKFGDDAHLDQLYVA